MLIRLVRMTFRTDRVETFLAMFDEAAPHIRAFPGCSRLALLQDVHHSNVLTTVSHWSDDAALQRYRTSTLFRATWERTKPLFSAPAEASSHHLIRTVSPKSRI